VGNTTGKDVFHVIDTFFSENKLDWKSCIHVCTDGAASMTGRVKGLNMYDKVCAFMKKIKLWESKCEDGDTSCFQQLNSYLSEGDVDRASIVQLGSTHLSNSYFPDIESKSAKLDWVRNPFMTESTENNIPTRLQENLLDVSSDRGLKMGYTETSLTQFWCDVENEYPDLGKHALNELLPFGSTYLCEVTFLSMAVIKS